MEFPEYARNKTAKDSVVDETKNINTQYKAFNDEIISKKTMCYSRDLPGKL